MITPEFIEKIALFYHFSLLDEVRAQNMTAKTIKKFRREEITAKVARREFTHVDIIRVTSEQLKVARNQARPVARAFSSGDLLLPEKSNFGPWFEFRKIADSKDFLVILYSRIMRFADEDIANGLNVPIGTVRFRMAKGLKILGQISHLGGGAHV